MEEVKTFKKSEDRRGAGWAKEGKNGKYISFQIEEDGVKKNYVMFKNTYKGPDSKEGTPDYVILQSKPRPQAE